MEVTARVGQVDLNEPSARTRGKGKRVGSRHQRNLAYYEDGRVE